MGKGFKFLLISFLFILLILSFYFKSKVKFKSVEIKKNSVTVSDFDMSKRVSEDEYYKIKSSKAEYSKDLNKVKMDGCNIVYKKGKNELELNADICEYLVDKKVILSGNIFGYYNDIEFKTVNEASCEYSFDNGSGNIDGRVVFHQKSNYIRADKAMFFSKANRIVFIGNVEVNYEMAD
ncbi:hypothetical protein FHQ18_07305 [Deferribacter autotrophicus]|uniref:LPS export ABC transporter periplasmic protein LptC n=1 Tax=Deferribacter autotrophicus TaxID=500465 RepID=A0A5A8F2L9_9BACT|nr:LPS export ABC transporter periplasmic protein LptC [Deferribacter autotrophicus]KAA0258192.1 hypothetical protein FHQ18_07305 [Deferribacter autotrophicus]